MENNVEFGYIIDKNGQTKYIGYFNKNLKYHSKGKLIDTNDCYYDGEF